MTSLIFRATYTFYDFDLRVLFWDIRCQSQLIPYCIRPLDSKLLIKNCILWTADFRATRTSSNPSVCTLSRSKINLVSCSSRYINSLSPMEEKKSIIKLKSS